MKMQRRIIAAIILLILLIVPHVNADNSEKCDKVFEKPDSCAFARQHCRDFDGMISYISSYYCSSVGPLLFILYTAFLALLFVFIGSAAGDFFCPNLNTIAQFLGLSENITGVTFLALGNGAPDLFASFGAIQQGSYGLAIGELLGAGSFITTVVVGAVAITAGFRVTRRPFLRDILFFLTAVIVLLIVMYDETITMLESIILILFYITYVAVVGVGRMIYQRQKKKRQERYRFQQSLAENSGENALIEQVNDEFVKLNAEEDVESLLSPQMSPTEEYPKSPTGSMFMTQNIQNHYDPWFFKHKTLTSLHFGYVNRSRLKQPDPSPARAARFKSSPTVIPDYHSTGSQDSAEYLLSDLGEEKSLPSSSTRRKSSFTSSMEDDEVHTKSTVTVPLSSRASLPDHVPEGNITSPIVPVSEEPVDWAKIKLELYFTVPKFITVVETFFPFVSTWAEATVMERLLNISSIPASVLLGITIPVVDVSMDEVAFNQSESDLLEDVERTPRWNRWLYLVHSFTIPMFCCLALGYWNSSLIGSFTYGALSVITSFASLGVAIRFTSLYRIPRYYKLLCLVGFLTAVLWIYNIAQEILTILQSIGIIMHISEAILGLTVLAIGNSLADLVADVTVAKMGYPNMAIAACFGGPLLNILLGVGISTLYYNTTHSVYYQLKFTRTLFLSAVGLLISLISSLFLIPANNWKGTKKYGYYLILIYAVLMAINVIIEIISHH